MIWYWILVGVLIVLIPPVGALAAALALCIRRPREVYKKHHGHCVATWTPTSASDWTRIDAYRIDGKDESAT